ncbi:MAG: hypothetical protein IJA95_07735 [Bacteroidaceae bacterium]|nr:hypothetical protein [Bacteroides sp.]MBQ4589162.1 hypothetical protein [Bacteroidaceae bacterium]
MKRNLLTVLLFAFCILGNAQNKFNLSGITSLVNYGIDYSLAKVFGGKESGHQYWVTYADINELFISKSKTFDIGKRLGIPVEVVSLQAVNDVNKQINPDHIKTTDNNYMPTEAQIAEAVKKLPILSQEEKYGIVMICLFMNKATDQATYQFVVFNTKTREIVEQWTNTGKALGIGLKNYWSFSVHNAIKKIK